MDLRQGHGQGCSVDPAIISVVGGRWREVALPNRIVAIQAKEWGGACGFRGLVVGSELGEWEPGRPVVLTIANMGPEILLHNGIHALGLAIRFRVEGGG